ncbi:MAG: type IV toxin-antitoxin system AbiEi family antitoxin [Aureispira sp.]
MDEDILHSALEKLSSTTEPNLQVETSLRNSDKGSYDGQLKLTLDTLEVNFVFKIKKRLSLSSLPLLNKHTSPKEDFLLISDYISKPSRKHLKERKISYLDTSGNIFITNRAGMYIYVETNNSNPFITKKTSNAFSKAGLKVIFQLLINEKILNEPYRYIAKASQVSLDTVRRILKELRKERYIIQVNAEQLKLQHKERLLQEWTTLFNRVLRPKLKQRTFKSKNFSGLKNLSSHPNVSIGGELAGEILSNYLIAENVIFYTNASFIKVAKDLQLMPSTNGAGSVTLVEKFWKTETDKAIIPPILAYADLLNNPIPRNLETAQIIYKKHVQNTV